MTLPKLLFPIVMLALFMFASSSSRLLQTYPTISTRTESVKRNCDAERKDLIKSEREYVSRDTALESTKGSLQYDSSVIFQGLFTGDNQSVQDQFMTNTTPIILYFVFFAIGLLILLISAPFLMCCCCCPYNCPCCCKQPKHEPYTKGSIALLSFTLILFSLLIIATMAAALIGKYTYEESYESTKCGISIILDDALHGNVTEDEENFFLGVRGVYNVLNDFNSQIETFKTQINDISSDGPVTSQILTDYDTQMTNLANVPNGAGGKLQLTYPSPIIEESPTATIASTFPDTLGTVSVEDSWVGVINNEMNITKLKVQAVAKSADQVENTVADFSSQINKSLEEVNSFGNSIEDINENLDISLKTAEKNFLNTTFTVFTIVVAVVIAIAFFVIVSTIFICFCEKFKCRYFLYFLCIFLFFLGIFFFLLTILFSLTTATSYMGCSYFQASLESPSNFFDKMKYVFRDDDFTRKVSQCVPSGNGQFVESLLGDEVIGFLEDSRNMFSELNNFDGLKIAEDLKNSVDGFQIKVQNYQTAKELDIDSGSADFTSLEKVSDSSNYPLCVDPDFSGDSWVPSVNQVTEYISCKVSGNDATSEQCATGFNDASNGCSGCMDTYDILASNTSRTDVTTALLLRYSGCSKFSDDLGNVWQNFHKVKKDVIAPVTQRAGTFETGTEQLSKDIEDNLIPTFQAAMDSLNQGFNSILDPTYGIIPGLNCRVLGEDLQLFVDIFCNKVFVTSYVLRILFALCSFAMLAAIFSIVRVGSRSYHNEEVAKIETMKPEYNGDYYGSTDSKGYPGGSAQGFRG